MDSEQVGEIKRYFGVVAEDLKREITQIAEGHAIIRNEMGEFREEVRNEFKEVRSLIWAHDFCSQTSEE